MFTVIPVLLYGREVCPLNADFDLPSLDSIVNRFFMKLFGTNVMDTVKRCQDRITLNRSA